MTVTSELGDDQLGMPLAVYVFIKYGNGWMYYDR